MKTLKTKLLVFVTILMLGMTAAAPAFSADCGTGWFSSGKECRNEAISDNTDGINDNAARIEQVNKEDMRVKRGELNDGTLTLRVEDMAKTQGRSEIYGKNVDIDLSDLDQSQEVGDNSSAISTNTTNINNNTTNIGNNADDIDRNSDRISNNDVDIFVNRVVSGAALGNSIRNSVNIENNEDRLDQNDVTNNRQDRDIATNAGDINSVQDQANFNTGGVILNSLRISGNDRDIRDNQRDIDRNSARATINSLGVIVNSARISGNDRDIAENEGRLDDNDATNRRQNYNIGNNAQGVADNADMNDAQNKVLRDHNGRIGANTTAISNVHGYTVDNRRDIDLNAYGIETNRRAIVDTNARIDGVMNDMRYLDRNLSAGIASAVAMGQHNFDPTYQGGQVSIAGGHFNGANAVSLAVGVPAGSNAFFSLSAAANDGPGNESIGMGLTYRLP